MSTVDQLLSQFNLAGGVAKANRYSISFADTGGERVNIMCDSVTWPGRQIATNEVMTTMKAIKRPYAFINDEVAISFLLTNDWYSWNLLKAWQSSVINNIDQVTGSYTVNLKSQYTKQVVINHLNERNQIMKSVKLIDAYPTTLNSMELSNGSENTMLRCSASFSFENWNSNDTVTSGVGPIFTNQQLAEE